MNLFKTTHPSDSLV